MRQSQYLGRQIITESKQVAVHSYQGSYSIDGGDSIPIRRKADEDKAHDAALARAKKVIDQRQENEQRDQGG
jgi:hypothetical protein